jgi:diguanylate cyclase (GGDEF)-like protein
MKILIADDSAVPRLILERTLTALGHETLSAVDGSDAWTAYQSFRPEVVISDWLMPGLDGIELCGRIRAEQGDRYTYFVLLTAMTEVEHVITAMVAGADDFLVKPLGQTALEATLIGARRVTDLHEELRAQRASLERLNSLLYDDARRDALTSLGNRLRLSEDLAAAVAQVGRSGQAGSIALLDIDHFKAFNDTLGHPAGDVALRSVAQAMAGSVSAADMVYRYGGEEFLILLPDQGQAQAAAVVDRVRRAIEALRLPHPSNPMSDVVTVSGGVAELDPDVPITVNEWLQRADAALYNAKATGRNRVMVFHAEAEVA